MDADTMNRLTPTILRRLQDTKASIADILHVRIDNAAALIIAQREEIERLRNGTNDHSPTRGTQPQPE
jgi:hypothetical protein